LSHRRAIPTTVLASAGILALAACSPATPAPTGLPMAHDNTDAHLPRDKFLGMDWNKGRYRKRDAFVELDHYLEVLRHKPGAFPGSTDPSRPTR